MSEDMVPEEDYEIPLRKAEVIKEGKDVTLLGYGASVRQLQMVNIEFYYESRQLKWQKKRELLVKLLT